MICSMTAFARVQNQENQIHLICEIRSINHRYLEIGLYLPDILRVFEMNIRERIKQQIKRGKIECVIRQSVLAEKENGFTINADLAKELCRASETIASFLQHPSSINPTDILRFPGVFATKEEEVNQIQPLLFQVLEKTLMEVISMRVREGEELKYLFLQRVDLIHKELSKVRERLPQVIIGQQERLQKRFADAQLDLEGYRLEQEMVIFAQKMDVTEEIDRLDTHLAEFKRILNEGGVIGRRLDFLLQELNREANTLGSKSTDSVMTHAALEMKVLIEQIREQAQNIE